MNALIRGGESIAAFLNFNPDELRTAILYEGLPVLECAGRLYARADALLRWLEGGVALGDIHPDPARHDYMAAVIDPNLSTLDGEAA